MMNDKSHCLVTTFQYRACLVQRNESAYSIQLQSTGSEELINSLNIIPRCPTMVTIKAIYKLKENDNVITFL